MMTLLIKWLIKDKDDIDKIKVRQSYGMLCGAVGIGLNLILFIIKLTAGFLSNSIAIMADAANNLSDAGSSVVTLFGFRLAGQDADQNHPFGHGRIEYLTGFIVSVVIVVMGLELCKTSIGKIINPNAINFGWLTVIILVVSIFVKLYMFYYNNAIAKKLKSASIHATATDSLSDCITTSVVLGSMIVSELTGLQIDGIGGLIVGCFILKAGFGAAKDTLSPLLGQPADPEYVKELTEFVMAHEQIVGVHDLVVHDYGPGRRMISLHTEVPASGNILKLHDTIDNIERELLAEFGCSAVIHMDPVVTDDELVNQLNAKVTEIVKGINPHLSMHDFRVVTGPTHTNLIFDIVIPFGLNLKDEEIVSSIKMQIEHMEGNYFAVIDVDKTSI
ncbi:MAG: cation transporter [Clostridia bacterium]|nr:cation transporter [Clostridia bacterium]